MRRKKPAAKPTDRAARFRAVWSGVTLAAKAFARKVRDSFRSVVAHWRERTMSGRNTKQHMTETGVTVWAGMKADRRRTLLFCCALLVALTGTSGVPLLSVPTSTWVWLLRASAVALTWLGVHTLASHELRLADYLAPAARKPRAAMQEHGWLLAPVAVVLLSAGVLWAGTLAALGADGGKWLLLRCVAGVLFSSAAAVLAASETAKMVLIEQRAARRRRTSRASTG